jgi:hypothetical protein
MLVVVVGGEEGVGDVVAAVTAVLEFKAKFCGEKKPIRADAVAATANKEIMATARATDVFL